MTKRLAHKITKPERKTTPEHVIFLDTETNLDKKLNGKTYHSLKLGVAIYVRFRRDVDTETKKVFRFDKVHHFWEFVLDNVHSKSVLYIMSHNAVFDFTVVKHIEYLSSIGYKSKFIFDNQMTFIAKWQKKNHSIVILNTANWFRGSVKMWGDTLNLPKLQMPKGLSTKERWFVYCERDAEILYQLFTWYKKFLLEHNLGSWKYTIPSQAFYAFRYRFMWHPIYIPDNEQETKLARESYHGGRTEVFRVGKYFNEPFYKLDVNSMYPYVMKTHRYPTCLEHVGESLAINKLDYTLEKHGMIADVSLNVTLPYFVAVYNERNIYPCGRFRTTLCTEELKLANRLGWIEKIHTYALYRMRILFNEYVEFFHSLKQQYSAENNKLLRSFTKLYLNSLYGKFGQRGYIDKVIGETNKPGMQVYYGFNITKQERYLVRQIGSQLIYSEKCGEGFNSFCAIASHVTANARLFLYDLVLRANRRNCYYCDTDSIIVNQAGFDNLTNLMNDGKLGYLKVEEAAQELIIVAPKHYYFGGHWTKKGIRKNAKELKENTYQQEVWPGLNTILKTKQEVYFNYDVIKHLSPTIVSGNVVENGFVEPFQL